MALTDRKITEIEKASNRVSVAPNRISGQPETAKQVFERLSLLICDRVNGLIDDLVKQSSVSGAEQIGCAGIPGIAGGASGTMKQMVERLKAEIETVAVAGLTENSISEAYLTADAVMKSLLTDYAIAAAGTPSDLATTDKVKDALGKLERHIKNLIAGIAVAGKAADYAATGGIKDALDGKQNSLTFDETPTADSTNPVMSGGIKTALDSKQGTLSWDETPTTGSNNPVRSQGIKTALDAKANQNLLKALALKDKTTAGDYTAGSITLADLESYSTLYRKFTVVTVPTTNTNYSTFYSSLNLSGIEGDGVAPKLIFNGEVEIQHLASSVTHCRESLSTDENNHIVLNREETGTVLVTLDQNTSPIKIYPNKIIIPRNSILGATAWRIDGGTCVIKASSANTKAIVYVPYTTSINLEL